MTVYEVVDAVALPFLAATALSAWMERPRTLLGAVVAVFAATAFLVDLVFTGAWLGVVPWEPGMWRHWADVPALLGFLVVVWWAGPHAPSSWSHRVVLGFAIVAFLIDAILVLQGFQGGPA